MKILAIDTTSKACSAAVVTEDTVLGEIFTDCKMDHSTSLLPSVDLILKRLSLTLSDMDYLACTCGPGSFTGVRIGAAAVKGLSMASGKKIVPIPSLDALAYNVSDGGNGVVVPLLDARRNQAYCCFYENNERTQEYMCEEIDYILKRIDDIGKKAVFVGEIAGFRGKNGTNSIRAAAVGFLAFERLETAVDAEDFNLIYVRAPQAEREYNAAHSGAKAPQRH
ncbi:tRNA (adenosine(37)-N6)-threonylcarbamoyltransferase complex dimerization subunit type 1 TsaB [Clostridia bacterium]|nr:tRNA (adenosine(37)-N6)-threonylcarbamoyltransferase complex dimerization subunit type 1 TsaB [Clostridia bacterium]